MSDENLKMSDKNSESRADDVDFEVLPDVAALRQVVRNNLEKDGDLQETYSKNFREISIQSPEKYEHLKGIRDHYKHKGMWSNFLMCVMAFMILFQCFLLWRVGGGYWDFSKYQWLLPVLLVQNLAQIIGLAVFVVKALFKDIK